MTFHVCGEACRRRPGLAEAHERTRVKMRATRLAKLHGRHPRPRWTAGR